MVAKRLEPLYTIVDVELDKVEPDVPLKDRPLLHNIDGKKKMEAEKKKAPPVEEEEDEEFVDTEFLRAMQKNVRKPDSKRERRSARWWN